MRARSSTSLGWARSTSERSHMLRMLRFLAPLLLVLPAFAGTASISTTATSISLASDPFPGGGKTQLNIRYSTWTFAANYGYENTDSSACYQATGSTAYLQLLDGSSGPL